MRFAAVLLTALVALFRVPFVFSSDISSPVVISEIMYNPSFDDNYNEWVELHNTGVDPLDLVGWTFCGKSVKSGYIERSGIVGNDTGLVIPPNGYAVLTDGGSGTEVYANFDVVGESTALHVDSSSLCNGSLPNSSDKELVLSSSEFSESVTYQISLGGNGNGKSLALFDDGWKEAEPTPGGLNDFDPVVPESQAEEQVPDPTISFSSPGSAGAGVPFSVSVNLSNFESGSYFVKVRAGLEGKLYDGRTKGTNGKWLAWNAPWADFPRVTVGTSGLAKKTVSAMINEDAVKGNYSIEVRIYDGDGFFDSEPKSIKVSAAAPASEGSSSINVGSSPSSTSSPPVSPASSVEADGQVLGEKSPQGFKLSFYLIVGILGLLVGSGGLVLGFRYRKNSSV